MTKSNTSDPANTDRAKLIEERRQYATGTLNRSDLCATPLQQFEQWLADARSAQLIDATSMALTTVDADHQPHTRIVLLKKFDENGFSWFTDQSSAKAQQLEVNPRACLLFFWRELERQVRIEGRVQMVPAAESDKYFHSRPPGSRFSAAASQQSSVVNNRLELETKVKELQEKYPQGDVPRPDQWGGYCLTPEYFEFWQGRNDRLHDRFAFTRAADAADKTSIPDAVWSTERLSP